MVHNSTRKPQRINEHPPTTHTRQDSHSGSRRKQSVGAKKISQLCLPALKNAIFSRDQLFHANSLGISQRVKIHFGIFPFRPPHAPFLLVLSQFISMQEKKKLDAEKKNQKIFTFSYINNSNFFSFVRVEKKSPLRHNPAFKKMLGSTYVLVYSRRKTRVAMVVQRLQ